MMSASLAEGARGGSIVLAGQIFKAIIQVVSVVTLSRLLSPEDFGLIAMVTVVLSLGELLRDFGLTTSGLRARHLSQYQASNLFWANTTLGLVAALLIALATPLLVAFYGQPQLTPIIPILAISLVANGMQAQMQVRLSRQRHYVALTLTDVASQIIAFVVAVVTAVIGWGYWALVAQALALSISLFFLRFLSTRWIPSWPHRNVGSKRLLKSGANFGASALLTFAANNVDSVAIGAIWGPTPLGLYNRAFQLLSTPASRLLAPLMNVVVPTINRVRESGESIQNAYLKIQSVVGIGVTFIFAASAGVASSLVPLLLGDDWSEAVPLFRILAIGGVGLGFSQVSYWMFVSEGRSVELLKYNLVTKTATVAMVVGGAFVSVEYAALGYALATALSWPINVIWIGRTTSLKASAFLRNGIRIMLAGLGAFLTGFLLENIWQGNDWVHAVVGVLSSLVVFVLLLSVSRKGRDDLKTVLKGAKKMSPVH